MSRFDIAAIISWRADQLARGEKSPLPLSEIRGKSAHEIAVMEIERRVDIPIDIEVNGEYVPVMTFLQK